MSSSWIVPCTLVLAPRPLEGSTNALYTDNYMQKCWQQQINPERSRRGFSPFGRVSRRQAKAGRTAGPNLVMMLSCLSGTLAACPMLGCLSPSAVNPSAWSRVCMICTSHPALGFTLNGSARD
ncbi:hypothetical protein BD413DRAFT_286138 [Trametes elegans]|nr:hypothetical protein BD413DRAFT_286138 [Trametes elegans]